MHQKLEFELSSEDLKKTAAPTLKKLNKIYKAQMSPKDKLRYQIPKILSLILFYMITLGLVLYFDMTKETINMYHPDLSIVDSMILWLSMSSSYTFIFLLLLYMFSILVVSYIQLYKYYLLYMKPYNKSILGKRKMLFTDEGIVVEMNELLEKRTWSLINCILELDDYIVIVVNRMLYYPISKDVFSKSDINYEIFLADLKARVKS